MYMSFNFFLGRFNAIFFTRVEKLCVPLRPQILRVTFKKKKPILEVLFH